MPRGAAVAGAKVEDVGLGSEGRVEGGGHVGDGVVGGEGYVGGGGAVEADVDVGAAPNGVVECVGIGGVVVGSGCGGCLGAVMGR